MLGPMRQMRGDRARQRRLDRESGYGAGYALEWLTIRGSRQWICERASGRTLELAAGTGLNLRRYAPPVELVALDLELAPLEVSGERAAALGWSISLAVADGQRLPFSHDTFDTVVCTLALCEMDDRMATLLEVHRVLKSGGSLLLLDHLEPRWRHGRPATLGKRAGFTISERQRLWLGYFERVRLQKAAPDGQGSARATPG